jgi:hypothetical protein
VGEVPQSPPICTDKQHTKITVCAILSRFILMIRIFKIEPKQIKIKSNAPSPYLPMIKGLYTFYSLANILKNL